VLLVPGEWIRVNQAHKAVLPPIEPDEHFEVEVRTDSQGETWFAIWRKKPADGDDRARLNFLEAQAKKSRTGISIDWVPSVEGERSGFRFMRYHDVQAPHDSVRAAIDSAMNTRQCPHCHLFGGHHFEKCPALSKRRGP